MKRSAIIFVVVWLFGCATKTYTPVDDLSMPVNGEQSYKVAAGDTIFSIAWRFDKDFKKLAASNNIPSPYIIHVGQILQLNKTQSQSKNIAKNTGNTVNQTSSPPVKSKVKSTSKKSSRGVSKRLPNVVKANSTDVGWLWPVQGTLVKAFSMGTKNVNKGIDIKAANAKVISSRSGKVVYAGNRLKGYGNLIIVKHSESFLSAYAHNKRLLVKEGDWVKQGQTIAHLGAEGTSYDSLHFEIRKQGKPVNPKKYLK